MGRDPTANAEARDRTERALRDAALELLAERGVHGMSMASLARRAGVSKGLAYHYFPTKRDLVRAVLEDRIASIRAIASSLPADLAPAERIRAFAHAIATATEADLASFRLYLRVLTDPSLREVLGDVALPEREGLVALFRECGVAEPELEARFFQVGLLGVLTQATASLRPTPVAPLVDRLLRAVLEER